MAILPLGHARIYWKYFEDLSDKDISPEGKSALSLEGAYWSHLESDHFVLHFMKNDEAPADLYVQAAETNYKQIMGTFGIQKDEWKKKAHIFVFYDKPRWIEFNSRRGAESRLKETQAYTNGWELFILHPEDKRWQIHTIAHELTHLVLYRTLQGEPPLALNEGFADFMGYAQSLPEQGYENTKIKIIRQMDYNSYTSLKEFLSASTYPRERLHEFYLQGEAFVRFMILNYGGPKFFAFLRDVSAGKSIDRSLETRYGLVFSSLEESFRNYLIKK